MRNVSHSFTWLSTWSWVAGTVWGCNRTLRWYSLARESMSKGVGFKGLLPCPASRSFILLPICGWDVISQLLAPAIVGIWPSGTVKQNKLFWDVVFHHSSRERPVPSVLKQCFRKLAHGACASNPMFLWVSHVFWNRHAVCYHKICFFLLLYSWVQGRDQNAFQY